MEKKDFKRILQNILADFGFQNKNKAFYFDNDSIITVISTQKSNYENSYYINFGFFIKEENTDAKYPKESDCDVFGRFILEYNGELYHNVDLDKFTSESLSTAISKFIKTNIKPALEFGLLKYLELNPKAMHTMSLKAKKYLKC